MVPSYVKRKIMRKYPQETKGGKKGKMK
jgi:hypothetical protein